MAEVTIDMIGPGRDGIKIPHRRFISKNLNEVATRQYFLEKVYEAGGPVEIKDDMYVLTDEIQISQDFINQDVTISWKKGSKNG